MVVKSQTCLQGTSITKTLSEIFYDYNYGSMNEFYDESRTINSATNVITAKAKLYIQQTACYSVCIQMTSSGDYQCMQQGTKHPGDVIYVEQTYSNGQEPAIVVIGEESSTGNKMKNYPFYPEQWFAHQEALEALDNAGKGLATVVIVFIVVGVLCGLGIICGIIACFVGACK